MSQVNINDLRINNIVFFNGFLCTIKSISEPKSLISIGFEVNNSELFGQHIDSDIMTNFGFVKKESFWSKGEFVIEQYDQTQAKVWWRGRYLGICQGLEYTHDLQNFYYSLTRKELAMKNHLCEN